LAKTPKFSFVRSSDVRIFFVPGVFPPSPWVSESRSCADVFTDSRGKGSTLLGAVLFIAGIAMLLLALTPVHITTQMWTNPDLDWHASCSWFWRKRQESSRKGATRRRTERPLVSELSSDAAQGGKMISANQEVSPTVKLANSAVGFRSFLAKIRRVSPYAVRWKPNGDHLR
jgi:hypothetical protein